MATARNSGTGHQPRTQHFGLLANGSCGKWEIAIDETTSGKDRCYAQIEGPSVDFYFEIPSLETIAKMVRFLEASPDAAKNPPNGSAKRSATLVIGNDKKVPTRIVKDDEYEDRFFFVFGPVENPVVRYTIAGTDVKEIAESLRQVQKDLEE
jgi:hypothetical protein